MSLPLDTENLLKKRGKGRGSDTESHQLKYGGSRTCFSFQIYRKHQGFCYFWEIGRMMRKEGKEEDRQQGSLVSNIGNIRGLPFFRGMTEGERRERRGLFDIVFFFFIFPSFMVILWRFLAFGRGCEGEKKGKKRTL